MESQAAIALLKHHKKHLARQCGVTGSALFGSTARGRATEHRDVDVAQFQNDPMRFDATVRNTELIGEAATHIPDAVRSATPQIPWRMVIATRKQLIHGYLAWDNDTLWSLVEVDIPVLLQQPKIMKADYAV